MKRTGVLVILSFFEFSSVYAAVLPQGQENTIPTPGAQVSYEAPVAQDKKGQLQRYANQWNYAFQMDIADSGSSVYKRSYDSLIQKIDGAQTLAQVQEYGELYLAAKEHLVDDLSAKLAKTFNGLHGRERCGFVAEYGEKLPSELMRAIDFQLISFYNDSLSSACGSGPAPIALPSVGALAGQARDASNFGERGVEGFAPVYDGGTARRPQGVSVRRSQEYYPEGLFSQAADLHLPPLDPNSSQLASHLSKVTGCSAQIVNAMIQVGQSLHFDVAKMDYTAAIINTESHCDVGAYSPAHARGIMQVIQSTGDSVAREHHLPPFTIANSYNPAYNLMVGMTLLDDLMKKHPGRWDLVAAEYNGGPGGVNPRTRMPETWAYIPAVMRHYRDHIASAQQELGAGAKLADGADQPAGQRRLDVASSEQKTPS